MATLLLGVTVCSLATAGDLFVVVNARNPTTSLSRREVISIFTGRLRSFPGDGPARAYDQARSSKVRESFYMSLTGMDLARVNSYWARAQFTGTVLSPPNLPNDSAIVAKISSDTQGIAYLTQRPQDPTLRVVYVVSEKIIGEAP